VERIVSSDTSFAGASFNGEKEYYIRNTGKSSVIVTPTG
jgi:hypothetical protein